MAPALLCLRREATFEIDFDGTVRLVGAASGRETTVATTLDGTVEAIGPCAPRASPAARDGLTLRILPGFGGGSVVECPGGIVLNVRTALDGTTAVEALRGAGLQRDYDEPRELARFESRLGGDIVVEEAGQPPLRLWQDLGGSSHLCLEDEKDRLSAGWQDLGPEGTLATVTTRGEQVLVEVGSGCGKSWDVNVGFDDVTRFAAVGRGRGGSGEEAGGEAEFELAGAGAWFSGACVGVCVGRGGEVSVVSPMVRLGPLVVVRDTQGRLLLGRRSTEMPDFLSYGLIKL